MRSTFGLAKEVTTCDLCGESLTIPPGLVYRGIKGHKQEIEQIMKRDLSNEKTAPELAHVEETLQRVLDVPQ